MTLDLDQIVSVAVRQQQILDALDRRVRYARRPATDWWGRPLPKREE